MYLVATRKRPKFIAEPVFMFFPLYRWSMSLTLSLRFHYEFTHEAAFLINDNIKTFFIVSLILALFFFFHERIFNKCDQKYLVIYLFRILKIVSSHSVNNYHLSVFLYTKSLNI